MWRPRPDWERCGITMHMIFGCAGKAATVIGSCFVAGPKARPSLLTICIWTLGPKSRSSQQPLTRARAPIRQRCGMIVFPRALLAIFYLLAIARPSFKSTYSMYGIINSSITRAALGFHRWPQVCSTVMLYGSVSRRRNATHFDVTTLTYMRTEPSPCFVGHCGPGDVRFRPVRVRVPPG
jgi:hypothetical protein